MATLYVICGSPAAGKTTYAQKLALERKAMLVDIDTATERLVKLGLKLSGRSEDDRDSEFFKSNFRDPIYEALFDIAAQNLRHADVIVVGPFTREIRDSKWPEALEARFGCRIEVHYLRCKPEIRRERMIARANPRDLPKLSDWETFSKYYGDEAPPAFAHTLVDTTLGH
jgi:predicted kinase